MKDYPKHREDWLHVDHYAKLSPRQNPYGLVCILCEKTHKASECPNKKAPEPEKFSTTYAKMYEYNEDDSYTHNCGW